MNDRFKFRVWDKDAGKYLRSNTFAIIDGKLAIWDLFKSTVNHAFYNQDHGINYIIEQCAGLKDKNGNLIFEGDEVKWSDAFNHGQGFIEFCDSEFHHSYNYCGFGVRSEYTEKNLVHGKMQYGEKETQIHALAKCCDYWLTGKNIHNEAKK